MDLRTQILQELKTESEKNRTQIKEYDNAITAELLARPAAFTTSARNACDMRTDAYRKKKKVVERKQKWISEMLSKYK